MVGSIPLDILLENIDQFTELVDLKMEKEAFSKVSLYDEKMESIRTAEVMFKNSKQSRQTEIDDLFKLSEPFVNNITVAA